MKTKRFLFTLLTIILSASGLHAQNSKLDSLVNLLGQHPNEDTVRANLLNDIAKALQRIDLKKSLSHAKEALELSEKLNFLVGKERSLYNLGWYYYSNGKYPLALEHYQKTLKIREAIGDKKGIGDCMNIIGNVYNSQDNYPKALDYYQKSLKIREEIVDKKGIAGSLNNIGIIYSDQGNNQQALDCYQISLKIKQELGDKRGIGNSLNNIGDIHEELGNYPQALDYYQKSLKMSEEIGNKLLANQVNRNIGSLYFKKGDYNKALYYTRKSLKIAEELEASGHLWKIYRRLSEIYAATQNYKLAYESHVMYKQISDSIFNEKNVKKITGLEYQYEFDKEKQAIRFEQEKKDALMEVEIKRERLIQYSALGGLFLVLLLAINLYRLYRIKTRANQQLFDKNKIIEECNEKLRNTLLELKTTQSSLVQSAKMASLGVLSAGVAHEINNPLNFIKGGALGLAKSVKNLNLKNEDRINRFISAINEGVNRVTSFVTSLSRFSQNENDMEEECDFHDILENCLVILQSYLKEKIIVKKNFTKDQVIRNGNSGQFHQALFNILTNAAQAIPETGEIEITTRHGPDRLSVTISDTGEGIDGAILDKIMDPLFTTKDPGEGMGMGLSSAYKNIDEHGGHIDVTSQVGVGTEVTITLPV